MNLSRLLVYIAVTAVSTYLIRVIPLVAIQKKIENRFFRSFLYYVPYAVLAAMIMPAVFYATGNLIASTIGFAIAMIFAYNKKNMVWVLNHTLDWALLFYNKFISNNFLNIKDLIKRMLPLIMVLPSQMTIDKVAYKINDDNEVFSIINNIYNEFQNKSTKNFKKW